MSDYPEQPNPSLRGKLKDKWHQSSSNLESGWHKFTSKFSPAHSPKPSRSTTPTPSDRKEGNKTDTPDTAPSKPSDPDTQALDIDTDPISKLHQWKTDNENSKWRKLAKTINGFLESESLTAAQEFIPDSPFPAKTLVKFLLTIIHLGTRVPAIQQQTYDFAEEAIEYMRNLVGAAEGEPTLWKDLETIRTEVNKICEWASKQVKTQLSADDLGDWQSQFEEVKKMFSTKVILEIRVAQAKEHRKNSIKEKLKNNIATKHKHTDQSKSLCAKDTRVEIQEQIMQWLSSQDPTDERIFWIMGIAGSGKSTLSATLVDKLRNTKIPVAAQFFISRNIPETIDPQKLVPTIALQLAESYPAVACIIEAALKNGLPGSQEEQVKKLLLAPIQEICKSQNRVIILIDALDELQDAATVVPEILSLLAPKLKDLDLTGNTNASKDYNLPDKIRFVVTSRPESWSDISGSKLNHTLFKQKDLTTDKAEVHSFIVAEFPKLKERQKKKGLNWDNWPSDNQVAKLSEKADGLFHYAATALQWIEKQIYDDGTVAQERVFDKFSQLGIGHLNDLYRAILTSFEDIDHPAPDSQQHGVRLASFQHVIGTILVLYKPLTIGQIITLLAHMSKHLDIENFLQRFRSVLIPGTTTSFEEATPQMHKSFRDYIMDEHAPPQEFRIITSQAHFVTAKSCLEVIVKAGSRTDDVVQYCVHYWHIHLQKAVEGAADFGDEGIWNLLGGMVKEEVINVWKADSWGVFLEVAAAGWGLLKQGTDKHKMEGISNILMKAKFFFREEEFFRRFFRERKRREIPYQSIWDHGLLQTWESNHPLSAVSSHSVSGDRILDV